MNADAEPSLGPWRTARQKLSRRGWLGLAAVALCRPGQAAAGQPRPTAGDDPAPVDDRQGYVDAHVHVWTPDTGRYRLAAGYRRDEMRPPSFTPEQLMNHARPCGVTQVVLIQMSFYGFDNSYLLAVIGEHPGRYSGVAVIDDDAADPPREMLRLAEQGVRGFRIYPRNRPLDEWLDGRGYAAMWRCGAEHGLAMCLLINPDALPAVERMCGAFPETPVVVDHFARIGIDGEIRRDDVDALCRLARFPRVYVKVSAYYALGRKEPPYDDLIPLVKRVYEAFGPRRLMWGSDCPFQVDRHAYRDSLELIRTRIDFLSEDDRGWILGGTARELFFA